MRFRFPFPHRSRRVEDALERMPPRLRADIGVPEPEARLPVGRPFARWPILPGAIFRS